MKRGLWILLLAVVVAVAVPTLYYRTARAPTRTMLEEGGGELEWLRKEFHLTDAQFTVIRKLHQAYAPKCEVMCARIADANAKASRLISEQRGMTPAVEAALRECVGVQADCRRAMLEHIYAVAAEMPREQGARYLEMMKGRILEPGLTQAAIISQSSTAR